MLVQARIADYLTDKGLIKTRVAANSSIQRARFSRLMNNKAEMTADEYERICKALEVPLEQFMDCPRKIE